MSALDAIDGLMLGGAELSARTIDDEARAVLRVPCRSTRYAAWLEEELGFDWTAAGWKTRRGPGGRIVVVLELDALKDTYAGLRSRWGPDGRVPADVHVTARALAYWFGGRGTRQPHGYAFALRLPCRTDAHDAETLAASLNVAWGWRAEVCWDRRRPWIRVARPGDRRALRAAVARYLPASFAGRLSVKLPDLAQQTQGGLRSTAGRRAGAKLSVEEAREIRRRVRAGEAGKALAEEFGISRAYVSRVASGRRRARDTIVATEQAKRGAGGS